MAGKRFVQLYTWYVSPNGKRQFCVVEKFGKHVDEQVAGGTVSNYQTTTVKLVETLKPNPINYPIEDFWDLVDGGQLVEYVPGVTQLKGQPASQTADSDFPDVPFN